MGVHSGNATLGGRDYSGIAVNLAARVAAAGHGGQVLLSGAAQAEAASDLPAGATTVGLGEFRLKDIEDAQRLHQLVLEGLPAEFPPLRVTRPGNLPAPLSAFVGRQDALRRIRALLGDTRLLTLTGPGGTGKSRLALESALAAAPAFADGAFFVPLAALNDPGLVLSAIADGLGVEQEAARSPLEVVQERLRGRRTLLLLDNFEHLRAAVPEVSAILSACSGATVLATSRSALRISGEQEYPVPPLEPEEAENLFWERARAVRPALSRSPAEVAAVQDICSRLDRLPLAIELAAARVRALAPAVILRRLERDLSLLEAGAGDLPARQRTLAATIAWSVDLLDKEARLVLARFSVFAGGAHLDVAEAVCGPDVDVVEGLAELVDQSLINLSEGAVEPRYSMLVTIRDHARGLLSEAEAGAVAGRHAAAMEALAADAEPHLLGPDSKSWVERLAVDHDNLRAALDWLEASGRSDRALVMAARLWRFWQVRVHLQEAATRLDRLLALPGPAPGSRLEGLEAAAGVHYWIGDLERSIVLYREELALAEALGRSDRAAAARFNLSFPVALVQGAVAAVELLEQSLEHYRASRDEAGMGRSLAGLANARLIAGDVALGRAAAVEAIPILERLGESHWVRWLQSIEAESYLMEGRPDDAEPCLRRVMEAFRAAGDMTGIVLTLADFAQLAHLRSDFERAARLLGWVDAQGGGSQVGINSHADRVRGRARPEEHLPAEVVARERAAGAAAPLEEVIAFALGGSDG